MVAKSTPASQPEPSQNGKKNTKAEVSAANKQDAEMKPRMNPSKRVPRAERNVDADKFKSRKQHIDRSNISKEHTDLIVSELNVPKLVAEKALLDNNNDVRAALTQLIAQ
ncbi:unnamed protein product [Umbelopsis vinacea]